MGFRVYSPPMENQTEANMENEMETRVIQGVKEFKLHYHNGYT